MKVKVKNNPPTRNNYPNGKANNDLNCCWSERQTDRPTSSQDTTFQKITRIYTSQQRTKQRYVSTTLKSL